MQIAVQPDDPFKPIDPQTLRDTVTNSVRQAILGGTLTPGSQINQVEVAAKLRVSRGPVREAFRRLNRARRGLALIADPVALASVEAPPEPPAPEPGLLAQLPKLLARVSPASRAVLMLHYPNGLSLEEVAEVLGISVGTVKSRLGYGLATLRRLLPADFQP